MIDGEIIARHFETRQAIRLCWKNGRISSLKKATHAPAPDVWIAPGLFDLQVNGYAGVDFQRDDLERADLVRASRGLRRDGCGRFLFTLITAKWAALISRLARARKIRRDSEYLGNAITGWHVEGPFLSSEPGFHGAHNPKWMLNPTPDKIRELRDAAGGDPLLLTIAPERPGAIEAIAVAVSMGIKVSLGHTNASAEILRQAVEAGASGFTHLGNGCPRELDRADNIIWRVLEIPSLAAGIIPDGAHVSPPLFRLFHRVIDSRKLFYTTDAMSAAGAPPGRYTLGELEMDVGSDQIVRQPGKPNFAGSALRPAVGVSRAAKMLGCDWQEVWPRYSEQPARFMGLENTLAIGQPANFCILKLNRKNKIQSVKFHSADQSL